MISIIIPNFNNAYWLPKCIESCLQQRDHLQEIIIVDDHSTDNSLEIIREYVEKYPSIVKLFINPGKGANAARNFGFEQSSGDFIQWLDSDDFLLPGKFDAQLLLLQQQKADIIYSDWLINYWRDGEKYHSEQKKYEDYFDFLLELLKDNWTSPNNYLMNRKTVEMLANGVGWNPETKVGQDREYFTMAGILGAKFQYVPGVFAVYNKQDKGTISGMNFKKRLELNQKLENRFREEIKKSQIIPNQVKKKYLSILDTHLLKACFYHPKIKLNSPINPVKIHWRLMHWKMQLMMPLIYIKKHLQYYL